MKRSITFSLRAGIALLFLASTLLNAQWKQASAPVGGLTIKSLALNGSILFAGTSANGVFVSKDNGHSLAEANTGLTNTRAFAVAGNGSSMYAGTYGGGVFVTNNDGATWTPVNNGLTNLNVTSLVASSGLLVAGTQVGVFISTNNGTDWNASKNGLPEALVNTVAALGTNVVAATQKGVFLSQDAGQNWTQVGQDMGSAANLVSSFVVNGTVIFAGTASGAFTSSNGGMTWVASNTGLSNLTINAMTVTNNVVFAGTDGGGVFLTRDNGLHWSSSNNGLVFTDIRAFVSTSKTLFVGTAGGGLFYHDLQQIIDDVPSLDYAENSRIIESIYPNPFHSSTTIRVHVENATRVTAEIFDLRGVKVCSLADNELMDLGTHTLNWDGRDTKGSSVSAGSYLLRVYNGSQRAAVKLLQITD